MRWVKTRETLAAAAALVFVALMGVYIAAANGIYIPVLTDLMQKVLRW